MQVDAIKYLGANPKMILEPKTMCFEGYNLVLQMILNDKYMYLFKINCNLDKVTRGYNNFYRNEMFI